MKNFILFLIIASFGGGLFSQVSDGTLLKMKNNTAKFAPAVPGKHLQVNQTAVKAAALSEGFEGTLFPPSGWTQLITRPSYTWHHDTTHSSPHSGTKKAGVLYDPTLATQNEWLYTPVINLTSYTHPMLEFWWNMSYYWGVDPYNNYNLNVKISTDGGTTWIQLWSEDSAGSFTSFEWYRTTLDLTAYNSFANVKIGFQYYGSDGAACSIDDIMIDEFRNNDLSIGNFLFSTNYSQIPLPQIDTIIFATDLTNIGYADQPNCKLHVNLNGSLFTSQSNPMNFPRAYYDTLVANNYFIPSSTGSYTVAYEIRSDSVDQNPSDNFDTTYFKVTDYIYAADNNYYANGDYEWGGMKTGNTETEPFVIGNRFLIYGPGNATSVYVVLAKGTSAGATIVANLYDDIDNAPIANSQFYVIQPEDIMTTTGETPKVVRLPLTSPIPMTGPAYYFAGIEFFGGPDTVKIAESRKHGYKYNQISLIYYNDPQGLDWYNLGTGTPMVRLGIDEPDYGITDNGQILFQNMPNPANRYTIVNYTLPADSKVTLSVYDITGSLVLCLDEGKMSAGTHSKYIPLEGLCAGSYFLSITTDNASLVKKLAVVK